MDTLNQHKQQTNKHKTVNPQNKTQQTNDNNKEKTIKHYETNQKQASKKTTNTHARATADINKQ